MAGIVGVIILALYGDRTPYYQDPMTYGQSYTKLTPLGQAQEVQLGSYLRSQFLNPNSARHIDGIAVDVVDDRQVLVRADNGGEGGAIVDSAVALLQGLYPPTPNSRANLANGTTVVGPMGGYQYVPVESVEPEQSIQLEGWTACPNFEKHVKAFYNSPGFKEKAKEAQPFLDAVKPYLFGIPNTLENMWNIYDYLNTNYIHDETYAFRLPPTFLQQAQAWVDYHEHGIFTDKNPDGIGNVAGRTILPSIVTSLERIASNADPLRLVVQEISYKPLISFFNITGVTEQHPDMKGLPTYASALALEVRKNDEGESYIHARFKNGTGSFEPVHLFGHKDDIFLNELLYRLDLTAVPDTPSWCQECGQSTARGCNLCSPDFITILPLGVDGDSDSCAARVLNFFNAPLVRLATFTLLAGLTLLGAMKLYKLTRRNQSVRLGGYEPLIAPGTAQYFDAPVAEAGKVRGRY